MTEELFKECTSFIEKFNEISSLRKIPQQPQNISTDAFELNHDLIVEEAKEYLEACANNDLKEIADAAGDMFFVLWGIICKHGMQNIFLQDILMPICVSNATKTCKTRDKALASVEAYKAKGFDTKYIEVDGIYAIFNIESMKMLKGINYQPPVIKV